MKKTAAEMEQNLAQSAARDKLVSLFDEDSFVELGKYVSKDGKDAAVISGYGTVDGISVYAYAQDSAVNSGAMSVSAAVKIKKIYELAQKNGAPVIGIFDSKGADMNEGMQVLAAYSEITAASAALSGVVPQIAVVDGVCAGTAAMTACMADIVIMTEKSELFMTAPFVAEDKTEGAGTAAAAAKSGVASIIAKDGEDALQTAKKLIALLPANNLEPADYFYETAENSAEITASAKGIDLIKAIADTDSAVVLGKDFGENAVTALGSLNCRTVGFVGADSGNRLSKSDSAKIARFVGFCDAFSIPIITLIDTEGFVLSSADELSGAVRDNAKLAQVYASATAPKIALITGKAYGSAYVAFAGSDISIAWASAVISPASPEAAVTFLQGAADATETASRVAQYEENEASPFTAASYGYIDRVIDPEETKAAIISAVESSSGKRVASPARKHINFVY
ncbi:MAG: acetyl-CoA carboxylase [Eubacterium sp.]|nr:acetyl-CoA carboxylase [Eubacterium sp.]